MQNILKGDQSSFTLVKICLSKMLYLITFEGDLFFCSEIFFPHFSLEKGEKLGKLQQKFLKNNRQKLGKNYYC